jgi:hypothetical protein
MLRLRLSFAKRSSILAQHDNLLGLLPANKKVRSSMRGSPELLTTISASDAESASPVALCREFAMYQLHLGFQSLT